MPFIPLNLVFLTDPTGPKLIAILTTRATYPARVSRIIRIAIARIRQRTVAATRHLKALQLLERQPKKNLERVYVCPCTEPTLANLQRQLPQIRQRALKLPQYPAHAPTLNIHTIHLTRRIINPPERWPSLEKQAIIQCRALQFEDW